MRVHLVGVLGTGMGDLAWLLAGAGHVVSGSDIAWTPVARSTLEAAGIRCFDGWSAEHVAADVEQVVLGEEVARDNPELARAAALEIAVSSLAAALRERFLAGRRPLVVVGAARTLGAAMAAWILDTAGLEPGFFVARRPTSFGVAARSAGTKRKIVGGTAKAAPFVVEGSAADASALHPKPAFLDYVAVGAPGEDVVLLTGLPDGGDGLAELIGKVPEAGLVVCEGRDEVACAIVTRQAVARTSFYALDTDAIGDVIAMWTGAMIGVDEGSGAQPFDLYAGGSSCGRFAIKLHGSENVRTAIGAIAACAEGFGVDIEKARQALATFEGFEPPAERHR